MEGPAFSALGAYSLIFSLLFISVNTKNRIFQCLLYGSWAGVQPTILFF